MRNGASISAVVASRDRFNSIEEAERVARRRLPRAMYQRLNGGADRGVTMRANIAAFERVWFRPRGAAAHPNRSQAVKVAGLDLDVPFMLAPIGALRLQHPQGACAAIEAASSFGTFCAVSPACGHGLDELARAGAANALYQVTTAISGRPKAEQDIDTAAALGFAGVVVTVDSVLRPKAVPLRLDLPTAIRLGPDLVRHPKWTLGFVRDGLQIGVANTALGAGAPTDARPICWADFEWIRSRWPGPLIVKGVMSASDARRAADAGADAVVVSNHGGLTLDGAAPTLNALPEVVAAVSSRVHVLVDGGVRSGADVVKAIALGARAVLIGRPYVMGLAISGEVGVSRVIEILRDDIDRTLAFLGCASIDDVGPDHIERG